MEGVPDGLKELFFKLGKKKGFSEEFLSEILEFFVRNQYLQQGDREHIRNNLRRIIEKGE
tara:strand:- start:398 stop:577 length:180 start_codon:yes stop_codon:yes gene_type:complete